MLKRLFTRLYLEGTLTIFQDPGVQGFLLTNLLPFHRDDPRAKFTVPLDIFKRSVPNIVDFPYVPGERSWEGKSLFVKGSKSPYVEPFSKFVSVG